MKLHKIEFDNYPNPETIEVSMSIREAAFITEVIGKLNDPQANEIMSDGADLMFKIYYCLTGNVFNRYWEEGIDGYLKGKEEVNTQ